MKQVFLPFLSISSHEYKNLFDGFAVLCVKSTIDIQIEKSQLICTKNDIITSFIISLKFKWLKPILNIVRANLTIELLLYWIKQYSGYHFIWSLSLPKTTVRKITIFLVKSCFKIIENKISLVLLYLQMSLSISL